MPSSNTLQLSSGHAQLLQQMSSSGHMAAAAETESAAMAQSEISRLRARVAELEARLSAKEVAFTSLEGACATVAVSAVSCRTAEQRCCGFRVLVCLIMCLCVRHHAGKLADLVASGSIDDEVATAQRELQEKVYHVCLSVCLSLCLTRRRARPSLRCRRRTSA